MSTITPATITPITPATITPATIIPAGISAAAIDLRNRIAGDVLLPTDDGFAAACAAWNLCFSHDPAVVVIAATADDITEAVRFAHAAEARVTIQATGHGVARPAADGVLIVTSRLTEVTIDPHARTARRTRRMAGHCHDLGRHRGVDRRGR